MANHCWNDVNITGDPAILARLQVLFNAYADYDYLVDWGNAFFPDLLDKPTHDGDYLYYGTRWWDFTCELNDDTLTISGDSAWSPPQKLVELISSVYKVNCKIEYSESGCDFAGKYEWNSGDLIEDINYTYSEYIYEEQGLDGIINEYLWDDDALENYSNADEFITALNINVTSSDMVRLDEYFKEKKGPMLDKQKTLEDLAVIETDLKNLSMNGLSKRVNYILECLSKEWKDDCNNKKEETTTSEGDKGP